MAARYKSVLQAGGKIAIPVEICNREEFMLKKGIRLKQSIDQNSIVLYRTPSESTGPTTANMLDSGCVITLEWEYLEKLAMHEGEPLYLSVSGDLIVIEKACCEKCGTIEHIVEYMPCHFRCTECIAYTIHWENEHKR